MLVPSNSDLNTLIDQAQTFQSQGSLTAVNAPVSASKWFLTVYLWANGPGDVPQGGIQKFETENGLWIRSFSYLPPNNTFGAWDRATKYL